MTAETVRPARDDQIVNHRDPRLPDRFWDKTTVNPETGCWEWFGKVDAKGYGGWRWKASPHRTGLAHRMAYLTLIGPVPNGLVLDHLCRVRNCVNPDHLEPVTQRENLRRGVGPELARTAQCVNGHVRTEANLYVSGAGRRCCRPCNRDAQRRRYERLRMSA